MFIYLFLIMFLVTFWNTFLEPNMIGFDLLYKYFMICKNLML